MFVLIRKYFYLCMAIAGIYQSSPPNKNNLALKPITLKRQFAHSGVFDIFTYIADRSLVNVEGGNVNYYTNGDAQFCWELASQAWSDFRLIVKVGRAGPGYCQ